MYRSFKEMPVWQEAMKIAEDIFALTEKLPRKEDYGLTTQLRRAAVSIPANIAEAFGRQHTKDKINFYCFSRGSIAETMSHIEYGRRVRYFSSEEIGGLCDKLESIYNDLNKLMKTLRNRAAV